MFYKYNNMTGRVSSTTNVLMPMPMNLSSLVKADTPPVIYDKGLKLSTVNPQKMVSRAGSTSGYSPLSTAFRKRQEHFQVPNDIPVHLKGGPMDVILYRTTLALCGVGIIMAVNLIWTMGKSKK